MTNIQHKRLLLDTNVVVKLSHPTEDDICITAIKAKIAKDYRIVVSPESLLELMNGIFNGKSEMHLRKHQSELLTLIGSSPHKVLRFHGDFALRSVLGIRSPVVKLDPNSFGRWIEVFLAARNLDEITNCKVRLPSRSGETYGMNKDLIAELANDGQRSYTDWLEAIKTANNAEFREPADWSRRYIGEQLQVSLTSEQASLLGNQLSAAYEHQKTCFKEVTDNPNLNTANKKGDWVDNNQLFYLCDPNLFILTADEKCKKKCVNSSQCNRILLLHEF